MKLVCAEFQKFRFRNLRIMDFIQSILRSLACSSNSDWSFNITGDFGIILLLLTLLTRSKISFTRDLSVYLLSLLRGAVMVFDDFLVFLRMFIKFSIIKVHIIIVPVFIQMHSSNIIFEPRTQDEALVNDIN